MDARIMTCIRCEELLCEFLRRVEAIKNARGNLNVIFRAYGHLLALANDVRDALNNRLSE